MAEREQAYKRAKTEGATEKVQRQNEVDRLKAQSVNLRKAKENAIRSKIGQATASNVDDHPEQPRDANPFPNARPLGDLDTTVRIKWQRSLHPTFDSPDSLRGFFAMSCGTVDSVVLSKKFETNASTKAGSAVVAFQTLSAAVKAINISVEKPTGFEDLTVSWASGEAPKALQEHTNGASVAAKQTAAPTSTATPSFAGAPAMDDEAALLHKMREKQRQRDAERERMAAEIQRQDEEDEAAA